MNNNQSFENYIKEARWNFVLMVNAKLPVEEFPEERTEIDDFVIAFDQLVSILKKSESKSKDDYNYIDPNHYQDFSFETIEMMEKIWGKEALLAHCEMCAFKYKMRAGSKPNQPIDRDLEKAQWYLNKAKQLKDLPF
ncbi:MAG: DUF3310 domain-containing protein [Bacteroidota bacterium]